MSLQSLRRRLLDLKAKVPALGKVRPVLLTVWEALGGRKPVRLPDWLPQAEPQSVRPPIFAPRGRGQRPVGQRQLREIRIILVDASTASSYGSKIESAPATDEDAS